MGQTFRVIDLFAGVGGIRLGVERAARHAGHMVECTYACDTDRFARTTYVARHQSGDPDVADHLWDDVRTTWMHVPTDFDVLLAGFPCQPFSLAGVSKKNSLGMAHGLEDLERGTLFDEITSILEDHVPPAFLLENVRHLLGHRGGETYDEIEKRLSSCAGGAYEWRIRRINSKSLVPQSRDRVYFVGYRRDVLELIAERSEAELSTLLWPAPARHLDPSGDSFWFPDLETGDGPRLATILHDHCAAPTSEDRSESDRIRAGDYTLSPDLWKYLEDYRAKHQGRGNGFGCTVFEPGTASPTRTLSARYHKDGSEILIAQKGDRPRRLTPRECARLMGFEDDEISFDGVSRTQAYRQMGNSVVVPVIQGIAARMLGHLALLTKEERVFPDLADLISAADAAA